MKFCCSCFWSFYCQLWYNSCAKFSQERCWDNMLLHLWAVSLLQLMQQGLQSISSQLVSCVFTAMQSTLQRVGNRSNVADMACQPFYKWIQETYTWHVVGLFAALFALGGFPAMVWGGALRIAWVYHITWFVNSASHCWGYQSYNTGLALTLSCPVLCCYKGTICSNFSIHVPVCACLAAKHVSSLCVAAVSL